MSRRYSLKQGIPTKLSFRIYRENYKSLCPTTMLLLSKVRAAKEVRIGGGEIYWKGWRNYEVYLPSALSYNGVHGDGGGNGIKIIDKYPLAFTGIILNLVPAKGVITFPEEQEVDKGYLLIDDIQATCDK